MKTDECKKLPDYFEFGPYRFDVRDQLLFKNGEEVHLTPKVAEILLLLLKQHGHLVEKEELMHEVWLDAIVEENNLTRNISTLRKILQAEPEAGEYIETIPRRGYRFITAVKEVHESFSSTEAEGIETASPKPVSEIVEPVSPTLSDTNAQQAATSAIEPTGTAPSAEPNHSREKRATFYKYMKPGSLLNTLLLVIIAILLFWQVRALYRISRGNQPEPVAGAFPRLRLNKHAVKGAPFKAELSPDGKYIAYAASDESGWQSLYFGQVNTNTAKQLVPPIESEYQGLSFAPDGSHLYFTRREQNQNTVLYRLAVFSDEPPQPLAALGAISPIELSPDGSRIAFIREFVGEGASALITANLDGSDEYKLFERKYPDFISLTGSPSWSPDGESILCVIGSLANGVRYQVASIQLNSEQSQPESALTVNQTRWPWIYQVEWSPSGRELFLLADEQPGGFRDQLWLMTWPEGDL
ncbi:MAG: winged helix-turn-helix domain-containing protein, partial [Acidobacteria bacterium]|nr:winged helix-turn-helix domain-containing protein [Acidobacteriota bacterium]